MQLGTGPRNTAWYWTSDSSVVRAYIFTVLDLDSGHMQWMRELMAWYALATGKVLYGLDTDMNLLALRASDRWGTAVILPTALPSETTESWTT